MFLNIYLCIIVDIEDIIVIMLYVYTQRYKYITSINKLYSKTCKNAIPKSNNFEISVK